MKRRTHVVSKVALGLAVAAAAPVASAHADAYLPGYTDVPNANRLEDRQRSQFIPGHTDVPNADRLGDRHRSPFVAGHTDVPNALRLSPAGTVPSVPIVVSSAPSASGFDWGDAGIGAAVAGAALAGLSGVSFGMRRRARVAASS